MISLFRRRPVVADDWYERAKPDELREYNAFGPWIYEVQEREDMPVRCLPWYSELENAFYVLKIPVNRDRRDARPGQDLYRAVVAIDAGRLVLLTLGVSGKVDCREVPFAEIEGLRNFHVLLHADFAFYLKDGTELTFSYNAVSLPLVERVLDFLSAKISGQPPDAVVVAGPKVPVVDHYFQHLVREHQFRHPGSRVVFCEEPGIRYRQNRRRSRSLGLLVLKTATEWLFLDRGSAVGPPSQSSYAGSATWVPSSVSPVFELSEPDPLQPQAGREFTVGLSGRRLTYRLVGETEGLLSHTIH